MRCVEGEEAKARRGGGLKGFEGRSECCLVQYAFLRIVSRLRAG